jgi:hypothetical protein
MPQTAPPSCPTSPKLKDEAKLVAPNYRDRYQRRMRQEDEQDLFVISTHKEQQEDGDRSQKARSKPPTISIAKTDTTSHSVQAAFVSEQEPKHAPSLQFNKSPQTHFNIKLKCNGRLLRGIAMAHRDFECKPPSHPVATSHNHLHVPSSHASASGSTAAPVSASKSGSDPGPRTEGLDETSISSNANANANGGNKTRPNGGREEVKGWTEDGHRKSAAMMDRSMQERVEDLCRMIDMAQTQTIIQTRLQGKPVLGTENFK